MIFTFERFNGSFKEIIIAHNLLESIDHHKDI
jgi:hypothetical protein